MKEKSMNEKKSTNWTAKKLAINALAIALVCVSTMVIQIPIPLGYMHLGNCCILLVSISFFCHLKNRQYSAFLQGQF